MALEWFRFGEPPLLNLSANIPVWAMYMAYRAPNGVEVPVYSYDDKTGQFVSLDQDNHVTFAYEGSKLLLKINDQTVARFEPGVVMARSIETNFVNIGEGVFFYLRSGSYPDPIAFIDIEGQIHVPQLTIGTPATTPQPLQFRITDGDGNVVCTIGADGMVALAYDDSDGTWIAVTETGEEILFDSEPWVFP